MGVVEVSRGVAERCDSFCGVVECVSCLAVWLKGVSCLAVCVCV
jgi:hypothetical protein